MTSLTTALSLLWALGSSGGGLDFGNPPVECVQKNGDPKSKINLVFLAEGYRKDELSKFSSDVRKVVARLFEYAPFSQYKERFNVYQVNVVSKESGSDHPDSGARVATAFETRYKDRFIEVGRWDRLRKARNRVPHWSSVVVLVNDGQPAGRAYLGSTTVAIVSTEPGFESVAVHEMGHSFAGLGDEYEEIDKKYSGPEPRFPNLTANPDPATVKWKHLLGQDGVGLFEGGGAYRRGIYRPTRFNCVMQNHGTTRFCRVCAEAIEKRIVSFGK